MLYYIIDILYHNILYDMINSGRSSLIVALPTVVILALTLVLPVDFAPNK